MNNPTEMLRMMEELYHADRTYHSCELVCKDDVHHLDDYETGRYRVMAKAAHASLMPLLVEARDAIQQTLDVFNSAEKIGLSQVSIKTSLMLDESLVKLNLAIGEG